MRVYRYSEEFKADALAVVEQGQRSISAIAIDLGIDPWTLRHWYKKKRGPMASRSKKKLQQRPDVVPFRETEAERIRRLERELAVARKENEQLRMDREILKKAAAFFAKESE